MISDLPSWYASEVRSPSRKIRATLLTGGNSEPGIYEDISGITISATLPMSSNKRRLFDGIYTITHGLSTFEAGGIPTAVSAGMIAPPIGESSSLNPGIWSQATSDSSGALAFMISIYFKGNHSVPVAVYTSGGPDIASGTARFESEDGYLATKPLECFSGYAMASPDAGRHYKRIIITVSSVSEPNVHLRVSEIELGSLLTIKEDSLAGELTIVDELDWLGARTPMSELDFSLTNIDGRFDPANPSGMGASISPGNRIMAVFSLEHGDESFPMPMGRFVITECSVQEDRVHVTAFDQRHVLAYKEADFSIAQGEDAYAMFGRLLTGSGVDYWLSEGLGAVLMPASAEYKGKAMSSIISDVCKATGCAAYMDRWGEVCIEEGNPSGDPYGTVAEANMYTWPESSDDPMYNVFTARWSDGSSSGTETVDGRTGGESPVTLSVSSALLKAQADARAVAERLASRMYTETVRIRWTGDPAMDMWDRAGYKTRYSSSAIEGRLFKRTITYDGHYEEEMSLLRPKA